MKSPHIIVLFWDLGIGGIQTRLKGVIDMILRNYPDAHITLLLKRKIDNEIRLPKSSRLHIYYYLTTHENAGYKSNFLFWLLARIYTQKPTHILAFLNRFALVAVLAKTVMLLRCSYRVRVIINQAVFTSYYINQYEAFYWHIIVALVYRFANAIIVPTRVMKSDLMHTYFINNHMIYVIPSWVKNQRFSTELKIFDAMFIGRLAVEKGLDTIIELAKALKRNEYMVRVGIVGDGDLRAWLINEISKGKLNKCIVYFGYKTDTLRFIRKARVLLLPSTNEGMPMVVLEAASVGVPAIVTNFVGADEVVIHGKTGWIFSRKEYISHTLRLLRQSNELRRAGVSAERNVRKEHGSDKLSAFVTLLMGTR